MKRTLLLACGLFIALYTTHLWSQNAALTTSGIDPGTAFNDTLMVLVPDGNKILITGKPIKELMAYAQADSIKQLFATDYEKALAANTLSADAPLLHYFVHASGKRRLKAEVGEYADGKVDVSYEITRLNLDLPKYRYVLHDLQSGVEMQLYLQQPSQLLTVLKEINLSEAIRAAGREKRSFRKIVKTEITPDNGLFKTVDVKGKTLQSIELNPSIGVTLLGNTLAPVLGLDLYYRSRNKYGISNYKVGLGISATPMVSTLGGEITKVSFVRSNEIRFLKKREFLESKTVLARCPIRTLIQRRFDVI